MPTVADTTRLVQRLLARSFTEARATNGGFALRSGTTAVFVEVKGWSQADRADSTWVHVWAPVAKDVPQSADLYRWIATTDHIFGGLRLSDEEGQCTVIFEYALLGDRLDEVELANAVRVVAATADEIDEDVVARFGGRRLIDE